MATAAFDATEGDTSVTLQAAPFLVRRLHVTSGTDAASLAHGGPAVPPDEVVAVCISAGPAATGYSVTARSTTTVTLDFEADDLRFYVYCKWYSAAAGGISA